MSSGSIPSLPGNESLRRSRIDSGVSSYISGSGDMSGARLSAGDPEPLEAEVAERLVALAHRGLEAVLGGAADEAVALVGVAGGGAEERRPRACGGGRP